ncbi:MAG: staygreen family protein [Anaerolineales bacterium]|nr:staygreen family protein [Anaerolineales bacterium]
MSALNPLKLHVTFQEGLSSSEISLPRRYTLTHSDLTGDLFLTIGAEYDRKQISGFYTRLMRDEAIAELLEDNLGISMHVYCHVSGGIVVGNAGWRYNIFRHHLPLVLEAFRHGDREWIHAHPLVDEARVIVHFESTHPKYNHLEDWGLLQAY